MPQFEADIDAIDIYPAVSTPSRHRETSSKSPDEEPLLHRHLRRPRLHRERLSVYRKTFTMKPIAHVNGAERLFKLRISVLMTVWRRLVFSPSSLTGCRSECWLCIYISYGER
ncbi:hypothetical protein BA011_39765 (plasmid) [Rhizobium leguminosarum]|uniref:Uncharacterized protein n=1 Tax=Rhizobium leguminosarum TaxID=384 RepID=A0A1B1CJZ3_RHILE|nr:hypothetical protein BA011_39765 [Rhizobium leguminosarum]